MTSRAFQLLGGFLFCVTAQGASLCPAEPDYWLPWPAPEDGRISVDADSVDLSESGVALITGDVVIRDADQEVSADRVRYLQDADRIEASGGVRYRTRDYRVTADRAQIDVGAEGGRLEGVTYHIKEGGGRGEATELEILDADHSRLSKVSYTTCPLTDPAWLLRADRMDLDYAEGTGTARGLKLRFKDVPLLYLPYASFPLDDRRKSGFLYPGIGSSDDNGVDLSVPWYWNIAPNQDATITPRLISDRGAMLGLEYRYLTRRAFGEFNGEYLPDDDRTDRHRAYVSYRHLGNISDGLLLDVDLQHVSDDEYFEDFGDSLAATSRSFLRSEAALRANGQWWEAALSADAYEIIDRDITAPREPYDRLPRFVFSGLKPIGNLLELAVDAEAVTFDRDFGVEGSRVDLYPRLNVPIYRPAYYLTPSLGLRHTAYDLDRAGDDSPSRTTAIASLEGGLFFERELSGDRLQTLEPRFHYLYVPFEPQRDLPEFDTREITFGFGQLFRTNRFTGADRQADANQLSLALTTRLFGADRGRQILEASIGTITYFRDQRVQLAGRSRTDLDTSPVIGEVHYRPSDFWRASIGVQYDPEDDVVDQTLIALQHQIPGGRIVNLAYRRRTDLVRQFDASVLIPLSERWKLIGRFNYSFLDDTDLETLVGFEYESCCWALRTMARRYLRDQDGDKRNGIYLELELKGLGSLGRSTEQLLERAILGYCSEDYR